MFVLRNKNVGVAQYSSAMANVSCGEQLGNGICFQDCHSSVICDLACGCLSFLLQVEGLKFPVQCECQSPLRVILYQPHG